MCFTSFGIIWAWIDYSWFASAHDTDDLLYRLLTMVQMIGVVIFTLGIPDLFHAAENGRFDSTVIVIGYGIVRLAMLVQWVRAARFNPAHRRAIRTYMVTLVHAQVLWIGTIWFKDSHLSLWVIFTIATLVTLIDLAGPAVAERGTGTPWHAHHIVERHGQLTIITIGEIVTGTVLATSSSGRRSRPSVVVCTSWRRRSRTSRSCTSTPSSLRSARSCRESSSSRSNS